MSRGRGANQLGYPVGNGLNQLVYPMAGSLNRVATAPRNVTMDVVTERMNALQRLLTTVVDDTYR